VRDLRALALLRARELRNRILLLGRQSRFKILVVTAFSVAFWIGLYKAFYTGFSFLHAAAVGYSFGDLVAAMFHVFFLALTVMLVVSNAIIGYTGFFRSRETGFLLALPVRPQSVFLYKFVEGLIFSSWAVLFLGTPLLAAYGRFFDAGPLFFPLSLAFLAVYLFLPAALGALAAMLVTAYLPRTRRGLLAVVSAGTMAAILAVVSRLLALKGTSVPDLKLAVEVFESIRFSRHPLLPSFWLSRGVLSLSEGDGRDVFFFFALILANALFATVLAHGMSSRLMMRGWFAVQGLRSRKIYGERGWADVLAEKLLFFVHPSVRRIVAKDLKSFVRDPVQWSQFLIFFGLLAIYFLNLRTFAYEERDLFWKNVIAQMNLLATALTLATFSSRFIFPQLSLEGRRFWVIGMAPMERERILGGKLALSFTCSLVLSEALIGLSSGMLRTPAALALLHAVALFGICLGLSGLAVGLGALYPDFREDNPSKIVSGFGGTLNLVLSLLFVLAVLTLQAVPCFLYYGRWVLGPAAFRWVVAGAMAGIGILSAAVCLVPMSLGLRAIRRLEI